MVAPRHRPARQHRHGPVARAVADAAGAEAVFDAGDDTSTGSTWEAFSLDSLDAAFDDGPYADSKWAVTGNHDHGSFVGDYLADHGWTMLDGEAVDGPAGTRLLGVDDPRSSGLGSWRDESGLSFDEVADRLADAACAGRRGRRADHHDPGPRRQPGRRGTGARLHRPGRRRPPPRPERPDRGDRRERRGRLQLHDRHDRRRGVRHRGRRRDPPPAGITLLTYRDGHPVGVQPVTLDTNGGVHGRRLRRARPVGGLRRQSVVADVR